MSDIAESLRACTENGADPEILFCAADEIDKLRAENARQAERIAELEEDIKESDDIRERCAYLLAETAVAFIDSTKGR